MVTKKYIKSRKVYKVTFEVPGDQLPKNMEVDQVSVVGDFNEWDPAATLMKATKGGVYKATVEFENEGVYQYRFCVNGSHWFNDWDADGYAPNPFGVDNCIVKISDELE